MSRLAQKGFAPEQISIYTNTPLATVNTLVANNFASNTLAKADIEQLFTYTRNDKTYMKQVLGKEKWKLQGETVQSQGERAGQPTATVDELQKAGAEDAFVFEAVNDAATPSIFRALYDQNFSGDSLRILKGATLQALSSFRAGNRFFGSADQALRSMGEAGIVATAVGTNTNRAAQKLAGEVSGKIAPLARAIQVDPTGKSQSQFHAFMEAYRSRTGEQMRGSFYDVSTGRVRLRDGSDLTYPSTGQVVSVAADSPVGRWLVAMQDVYNPISRAARDTNRRLVGETTATEAGLYIPYVPMDERLVAYIFNRDDINKTRVITA